MPISVDTPHRPISGEQIPSNPPDLSKKLPKLTPRRKTSSTPRPTSPAPETPSLPPVPPSIIFQHPTRRILSPKDHELFLASPTYTLITSFIFSITDSVRDVPISTISSQIQHPTITALLNILSKISALQQLHPADHTNGSRFGNPAFRTFLAALSPLLNTYHTTHLSITSPGSLDELHTYLHASFGSSLRIDYGSGHELNFLIYTLCLHRLGHLPTSTFPALALLVFPAYLSLMRTIQETYYLEPAGSHGVWGLDDYHFLPFLFGAAQLANHPHITPLSIHSAPTIEGYADDFLYLDMVRHVNATKTVQGLRWHSPMLDDISGVKVKDGGWRKVEAGMRKMFLREVLGKLVVMQHFLFGGIVPAVEGMGGEEEEEGLRERHGDEADGEVVRSEGHEGHKHNGDAWGDCCGIKVPSSVGAVGEMRKRMSGEGLRRLPFD